AVGGRLSEHPGRQSNRVDHPKLANAKTGVERRLAADVVAERGVGDLDHQQDIAGVEASDAARSRIDDDVRLEISVFVQAKCCLGDEPEFIWGGAIPSLE